MISYFTQCDIISKAAVTCALYINPDVNYYNHKNKTYFKSNLNVALLKFINNVKQK